MSNIQSSILSRIESPSSTKNWIIALYGPPGVGKTSLAATLPNPLFIDCENSTRTLAKDLETKAKVIHVSSYDEVTKCIRELRRNAGGILDSYSTIVMDTFSELSDLRLQDIVAQNAAKRPEGTAEWPDYKVLANDMRKLAIMFKELDTNVVLICHDTSDKDELSGIVSIRPDLTPKVYGFIRSLTDGVFYMQMEVKMQKESRFLLTHPTTRIAAKDRFGLASKYNLAENPNILNELTTTIVTPKG